MAKKTVSLSEAVEAFRTIADYLEQSGGITSGDSSAADGVELLDEEEVRTLPIKELRALAERLGLDEVKMKNGILSELEAKGHFGEEEEDEDDEEPDEDEADDEEEEDEDEEEGYTREELEEMDLKQLRATAKSEGHSAADYRGMDQDALIDLILGEADEDEEDEDDEEDEEEEFEEIDEDALKAMDLTQLKGIAKEMDITIPPRIAKNKTKVIEFILAKAGEEDDE